MIEIKRDQTEELRRTFADYVQYNRRDLELLKQQTLRKLCFELNKAAQDIAPDRQEIATKVQSLGWRVIKKGKPEQWGVYAANQQQKVSMRGMNKEQRAAEKARRKAELASVDDKVKMMNYVISRRNRASGFLASAYRIAGRLLGFSIGKKTGFTAEATVSQSGNSTTITAIAPGIETVDAEKGFVSVAIANLVADMQIYIDERQAKGRERLKR